MAAQMPICVKLEDNFWDELFWDEELSDTTLIVKDKAGKSIWEFKVHSIVLRRRSKVFKQMITKIGETIAVDDVSVVVLKKFLKYLYVGDIYVETWPEIIEFVGLAAKYEVTSLLNDLELALIKFVRLVTVSDIMEVSRRLKLVKLEKECLDLIVRGAVVVFGTEGSLRLSREVVETIVSDNRLNVTREVDVILYLICWAKANAFNSGQKINDEDLFKRMEPFLQHVRFSQITLKDQQAVPTSIRNLVFPKESKPSKETAKKEPLKPREPSKTTCLLSNYAELIMREDNSTISWISTGTGEVLVLRFSVSMPIFVGGFLMHYRLNGAGRARGVIRVSESTSEAPTDVSFALTHKTCAHRLTNEMAQRDYYQAFCYEPETPILLNTGDECKIYLTLVGSHGLEMPRISFPFTSLKSKEGPIFRLHMDTVTAVKKIHFLSACGRCVMDVRD